MTPDRTAPRTTAEERAYWLTDEGWKGMSLRDLQLLLGDYAALTTRERALVAALRVEHVEGMEEFYADYEDPLEEHQQQNPHCSVCDLLAGSTRLGQPVAQDEVARLRELLRQSEEEWGAECVRLREALVMCEPALQAAHYGIIGKTVDARGVSSDEVSEMTFEALQATRAALSGEAQG